MPPLTHRRLISRRHFIAGSAALTAGLAAAPPLGATGRPLLKVTFASGEVSEFDEERLASLAWQDLHTHTFWTEGLQHFRGPRLADVMLSGASREDLNGRRLSMRALNDFMVEIPAAEIFQFEPLLAREMNGARMTLRDKGPLWLVYPRDERPELQNPAYDERWIWQLSAIHVI